MSPKIIQTHYPLITFSCNEFIEENHKVRKKLTKFEIFVKSSTFAELSLEYSLNLTNDQMSKCNLYDYVSIIRAYNTEWSRFQLKYSMFSYNNILHKIEEFDNETKTVIGSLVNHEFYNLLNDIEHTSEFDLVQTKLEDLNFVLHEINEIVVCGIYMYLNGQIIHIFNIESLDEFKEHPLETVKSLVNYHIISLNIGEYTIYCSDISLDVLEEKLIIE